MFAFPAFDFEMHMQESMGVLGVMSCLADEADSELGKDTRHNQIVNTV